jgi:hypothetical protein
LAEDFVMEYRNAKYNAVGTVDCEINHPRYGWIPFTANPNDVEPLGSQVFDSAKDTAAPYIAPPPVAPTAVEIRSQRNALLAASDWIVTASYERGEPVPEAWATYRQALRDIPQQAGFSHDVIWPTKPE